MEPRNRVSMAIFVVCTVLLAICSAAQADSYSSSNDARVTMLVISEWIPEVSEKQSHASIADSGNVCALKLPGVTCSGEGRVISIEIGGQNLQGTIPALLGELTFLETLDLSGNRFYGVIPESLARLPRLRHFNIEGNPISGSLPSSVGSFPALKHLNTRGTLLSICPSPTWVQQITSCCISRPDQKGCASTFAHCNGACQDEVVIFKNSARRADEPGVPSSGSSKLTSPQIAGIAVAAAIGLVLIGVAIFFIIVETRRKSEPEPQIEMPRRFGHQDSSLTTMDSRRDLSRPERSKPPAPEPESSSSSSSSSSEDVEEVPPPKPKKAKKAAAAEEEPAEGTMEAEESKEASNLKDSDAALLKPKRKKKKAKAAAAAAATNDEE